MSSKLLPLPIAPRDALTQIILPAWRVLPPAMSTILAQLFVLAVMLQESALKYRWQIIDPKRPDRMGPARGLAQFELGTKASRGGVWGVYLHQSSRYWLHEVCVAHRIPFEPRAIYDQLHVNDELSACLARLLAFTDPRPLPALGDWEEAWRYYLRNWRPGAYDRGTSTQRAQLREKFRRNYEIAHNAVKGEA